MSHKNFINSTSIIFLIIGLLHLVRVIYGTRVIVGTSVIPTWASIVVVVVAAYLSIQGFKMSK
ncbi:MAG TPA: hypothetical protein VJH55_01350 [Candidatus Paceibacterota bacterium]